MTKPAVIACAITGSVPRKEDNPAVPTTPAEKWVLAREAGGVRIGLEDNLRIDKTRLAASNAELVELAAEALVRHGRRPATAAEARAMLGLAA